MNGAALANCHAEELFWGDHEQAQYLLDKYERVSLVSVHGTVSGDICLLIFCLRYGPFDVVWVSDCLNPIYGLDSYEKLSQSVRHLAGPNTCVA